MDNKLNDIILHCKGSVTIMVNNHKDSYYTVEQYIETLIFYDEDLKDEISPNLMKDMIDNDSIVEIIAYPHTPIGSYHVYHYNIEKAIEEMHDILRSAFK